MASKKKLLKFLTKNLEDKKKAHFFAAALKNKARSLIVLRKIFKRF